MVVVYTSRNVSMLLWYDKVCYCTIFRQVPRPARPTHQNRLTPQLGRLRFVNALRHMTRCYAVGQYVLLSSVVDVYVVVAAVCLPRTNVGVRIVRRSFRVYTRVGLTIVDVMLGCYVVGQPFRFLRFLVPILLPIVLRRVVLRCQIVPGQWWLGWHIRCDAPRDPYLSDL